MSENIGEMIKQKRKEKGLTLAEVGEAVGVGYSTVRKWEMGMISNMKRDKIPKLSKILDIPLDYFIFGELKDDTNRTTLISMIKGMNDSQIERLLEFACFLNAERSKHEI